MSTWASVAADTAENWATTSSTAESYVAASDSTETFTYIETIWDAGASVWDDGTSFWDGAYQNDWNAASADTVESWA